MPTLLILLTGCLWISDDEHAARTAADDTGVVVGCGSDDCDGDGYAGGDDCDDTDDAIHPGAPEGCDHVDNDCDGDVDEGAFGYVDGDGDGWGDDDKTSTECDPGLVAEGGDCDDADADSHPGAGERCDAADNDCDDTIDEDPVDGTTGYLDDDGDGYGDQEVVACALGDGYVADGGDCADDNPMAYPGAIEICDGAQNDCLTAWTSDDGLVSIEHVESGRWEDLSGMDAVTAIEILSPAALAVCPGTHLLRLEVYADLEIDGPAGLEATVLDGGEHGSVISVEGVELSVTGVTIQSGYAASGGGIYAEGAVLTLRDVLLTGNGADRKGGGLYANDSDVELEFVEFTDNYALDAGGGVAVVSGVFSSNASSFKGNISLFAGGAHLFGDVTAELIDDAFVANEADDSGGGLYITQGVFLNAEGVSFQENVAWSYGAGLYTSDANASFTGGEFVYNTAGDGGAVFHTYESLSSFEETYFDGNTPQDAYHYIFDASTGATTGVGSDWPGTSTFYCDSSACQEF